MADVNRGNRPLSPHLSVYKPQMTSMSSIFVRLTGNAMLVAGLMITWWFVALAAGPEAFATADAFLRSWFGDLVLVLSTWALWYHTLGGLRHLIWDAGFGFDVRHAELMGWGMFGGAFVLTFLTILVV
ncbi:MAG: succinate dehydrogenase, cytochrome b556 subunit [Shimia sp.]